MNSLWTDTTPSLLLFGGIFAVCWFAVAIFTGVYREWMRRRINARRTYRAFICNRQRAGLPYRCWRNARKGM